MNELKLRVITATILFAAAVGWLFYLPSFWFDVVLGGVAVAATTELLCMVDMPRRVWFALLAVLMWAILIGTHGYGMFMPMAWLILMLGWFGVLLFLVGDEPLQMVFQKMLYAQWMMLWLMLFVVVVMQLHAHQHGVAFIAGACVGIWVSDIAAYFTGRALGKRKLCPAVSPGKTWEGFAGGVLGGVISAALVWVFWAEVPLFLAIALALLLVVSGVIGDLAESALKRVVGVKDSGNMLPGHGGLLDRIDALLPALPLAGLLWMICCG